MSGLEELLTGRTLVKRYRIQEVIGRGGFAAVYRADDERLGRPVAVKVISIAAQDPEAAERHRERFEREARAAASLPQHPNVVTVHDFGVDPTLGLDFLVMEFLHGEDLATRLRREGKPPLDEALRILREAAAGIAVGHRAGIVHRDVKPGNIFLARNGPSDALRVCILDFGIAQMLTEDHTLTRVPGEGTPLSPAYASPEQTRGAHEIGAASDVFSLGVVGYQLLTGEKPFPPQRGLDPAAWTPLRGIRELNPEVPPTVEAVLLRALAYSPEDRFADAEDFATALASAMGGGESAPASSAAKAAGVGAVAAPSAAHDELDRTLFQPPEDHTPFQEAPPPSVRSQPRVLHAPEPARRRGGGGVVILVLLLLAAGAGAGWWLLGRSDSREPVDRGAAADVEAITEGLEGDGDLSAPDGGGAGAANAGAGTPEPVVMPTAPPAAEIGSGLPTLPSPRDTLPPQTETSDSTPGTGDNAAATRDSTVAPADTSAPRPDSTRPPPRVIGVPVDSVASSAPPTSAAAPSGPR